MTVTQIKPLDSFHFRDQKHIGTIIIIIPDNAVDRQKLGFWIFLNSSKASLEQFYTFNYATEGQHEQIIENYNNYYSFQLKLAYRLAAVSLSISCSCKNDHSFLCC